MVDELARCPEANAREDGDADLCTEQNPWSPAGNRAATASVGRAGVFTPSKGEAVPWGAERPLRVLHFITQLGSGGAERMLTRIATYDFGSSAPRQAVVSLMDEGVYGPVLRAHGVELHCLGMRRSRVSPLALVRAVRLVRRLAPDVVMTWLYHADLLGTLAARLGGVRTIAWNIRGSDMEFRHYAAATRWTVALLTRMSAYPGAVAVNSRAGQRAHAAFGYRPRRWVHLPNGFDLAEWCPAPADRAQVRRELGLPPETLAVSAVARVDPQKDHATLFAAAVLLVSRHPEVCFVLAGKGTDRLAVPAPLRSHVLALGERHDIPRLLRGMDLAVLSSAFGEGFPNAVGEAMATGLVPVVTDVGDAADLVSGVGFAVPPRNPAALAAALREAIRLPPGERAKRGQAAREKIAREYALGHVAKRYRALWEELAGARRS